MTKKKILCLCHGGNVRSATLAWLLKDEGHCAIPVGVSRTDGETMALLANWADVITVAQQFMSLDVPGDYRHKVVSWGIVGPDIWRRPMMETLMARYHAQIPKEFRALEDPPIGELTDEIRTQ